ncbi:MAG TPA: M20/M25/M40 family metallo-hydrolase [bacterium]|nr:M20/M25/M40 family metallo-hydrolase [bacterium]
MRRLAPLALVSLFLAACAAVTAGLSPVPGTLSAAPHLATEIACDLSDRVGPRLAGSAGDARAVAWAQKKMLALGLTNAHTEAATVPHWERGAASAVLSGDGIEQSLAVTALGGSVATPAAGIEAEVVEVDSLKSLEKLSDDAVRGKIVFINQAMTRGRDAFNSYGNTVEIRGSGATAAAKHGAVAVVIRSVGTSAARFPHTGGMRYAEGTPKIPAGALAVPDAELLHRLLAAGAKVRLKLVLETRDLGTSPSANVVADVRGTEKPDEIVLIGAHLDSWDLGRGAIDDAAGVGVVLDVAHALLATPPKRTVRVILFANEENGLAGARAYAAAHGPELAKHQAALEIDAGAGRVFASEWNGAPSAAAFFDALGARLAPLGIEAPKSDPDAGGADTIPLRFAGVPTVDLLQDGTRYFDLHHTADDTCEKIVAADLDQVRDATLITTWSLADAPSLFERAPHAAPPAWANPTPTPAPSPVPATTH